MIRFLQIIEGLCLVIFMGLLFYAIRTPGFSETTNYKGAIGFLLILTCFVFYIRKRQVKKAEK